MTTFYLSRAHRAQQVTPPKYISPHLFISIYYYFYLRYVTSFFLTLSRWSIYRGWEKMPAIYNTWHIHTRAHAYNLCINHISWYHPNDYTIRTPNRKPTFALKPYSHVKKSAPSFFYYSFNFDISWYTLRYTVTAGFRTFSTENKISFNGTVGDHSQDINLNWL